MIKVSQYKVEPIEDKGIRKTFFDLYNEKIFGQHTTNQSLQKKLDRFRDNMAIDFYNLVLEIEKHPINERWESAKGTIEEFANKYLIYKQVGEKPIEYIGDQIDSNVFDLIIYAENDDYLGLFIPIANKVIEKKALSQKELDLINNWVLGRIIQNERNSGGFILLKEYTPFHNFGMIRALYEWVVLVSQGGAKVGRCEAEGCDKLFLPYKPGAIAQIYCSKVCKMREYRRRQKELVTTE